MVVVTEVAGHPIDVQTDRGELLRDGVGEGRGGLKWAGGQLPGVVKEVSVDTQRLAGGRQVPKVGTRRWQDVQPLPWSISS